MAFSRRAKTLKKINVTLAGAALAGAMVFAFSLAGPESETPDPAPDRTPGQDAPGEMPVERYSAITERNIFRLQPTPEPPPPPRPEPPRPETPRLSLKGTVLFSSGGGYAILQVGGEQSEETVRVGGTIAGMELASLEWNRAVLKGPEGEIELAISTDAAPDEAPAEAQPPARPAPGERRRPGGFETFNVPRSRFNEAMQNPVRLMSDVHIRPNVTAEGTEGFVVSGIRPGSMPDEFGLRDGDIISRVNNTPLDGPETIMRIYSQIAERGAADIRVIRDGQPVNLRYRIER